MLDWALLPRGSERRRSFPINHDLARLVFSSLSYRRGAATQKQRHPFVSSIASSSIIDSIIINHRYHHHHHQSNNTSILHIMTAAPTRFIFSDQDHAKFLDSPVKAEFLKLVTAMGRSCTDVTSFQFNPEQPLTGLSPAMACLHGALSQMQTWLEDFPPDTTVQARFGNPSFKKWHERWVERSPNIVYTILKVNQEYPDPKDYEMEVLQLAATRGTEAAQASLDMETIADEQDREVIVELCAYLHDAFGHVVRLDYGTGHESSFQVFLFSLCKIGCFGSTPTEPPSKERLKAITLSIYSAYLAITRQVQTDYMLEPAGSHGVWGLDDYHCLPFYYGACQMQGIDEELSPSSIHDDLLLDKEGQRLMYLGCIRYIKSLKKGVPFFECSPMLNDISNLNSWSKVSSGLLRLYEGEVLKKRPVVQHFVFGKLFPANWKASQAPRPPPEGNQSFRSAAAPGVVTGSAQLPATRAPWADERTLSPPPSPKRAANRGVGVKKVAEKGADKKAGAETETKNARTTDE